MRNKFLAVFLLVVTVIGVSSCKKDYVFGDIVPNTDRVIVEFTDSKSSSVLSLNYGTQIVNTGLTELRFSPRSKLSQDAVVKFRLNTSLIADYNSANGTNVQALPPGSYTLETTELTLTQTERGKEIPIKILPSAVTGGDYALGLSISSTTYGEISPVAHDVLVFVQVKNDYEGLYYASGQRTLYNGPTVASGIASVFDIDTDKYLYTIDQTTVETDVADLIGGGWMFLQVNPLTNQVTVMPSAVSPTFLLSNNGPCTYDPVTKTFSLAYKYFNAAGNLRIISEKIEAY
jgi:hypothetical protein